MVSSKKQENNLYCHSHGTCNNKDACYQMSFSGFYLIHLSSAVDTF